MPKNFFGVLRFLARFRKSEKINFFPKDTMYSANSGRLTCDHLFVPTSLRDELEPMDVSVAIDFLIKKFLYNSNIKFEEILPCSIVITEDPRFINPSSSQFIYFKMTLTYMYKDKCHVKYYNDFARRKINKAVEEMIY